MTSLHLYFHWIILIQGQVILCPFRNILFNFLLKAYMYFKKFELNFKKLYIKVKNGTYMLKANKAFKSFFLNGFK